MRLLNVDTLQFQDFHGTKPLYVILSHRWTDRELTYQDMLREDRESLPGFDKVKRLREATRTFNSVGRQKACPALNWMWLDTCCIDKTSSAELQEAIASMCRWYREASVCFAYLPDVKASNALSKSVWFTRGWTLQELLASKTVIFHNMDWIPIGFKSGTHASKWFTQKGVGGPCLNVTISRITQVPETVLRDFSQTKMISVAEKQKWMKGRTTTRIEDRAYCQLGIFDVFMPLIYGEGDRAMLRLEEEINKELARRTPKAPLGSAAASSTGINVTAADPPVQSKTIRIHRWIWRGWPRNWGPDRKKTFTTTTVFSNQTLGEILDWLNESKSLGDGKFDTLDIRDKNNQVYYRRPRSLFHGFYRWPHSTKLATVWNYLASLQAWEKTT